MGRLQEIHARVFTQHQLQEPRGKNPMSIDGWRTHRSRLIPVMDYDSAMRDSVC